MAKWSDGVDDEIAVVMVLIVLVMVHVCCYGGWFKEHRRWSSRHIFFHTTYFWNFLCCVQLLDLGDTPYTHMTAHDT